MRKLSGSSISSTYLNHQKYAYLLHQRVVRFQKNCASIVTSILSKEIQKIKINKIGGLDKDSNQLRQSIFDGYTSNARMILFKLIVSIPKFIIIN